MNPEQQGCISWKVMIMVMPAFTAWLNQGMDGAQQGCFKSFVAEFPGALPLQVQADVGQFEQAH